MKKRYSLVAILITLLTSVYVRKNAFGWRVTSKGTAP